MTYLAAQRIADWPAFLVAVLAHTPAARNQVHRQQPELPPALFGGRHWPASAAAGCSRSGRSSCLPAGSDNASPVAPKKIFRSPAARMRCFDGFSCPMKADRSDRNRDVSCATTLHGVPVRRMGFHVARIQRGRDETVFGPAPRRKIAGRAARFLQQRDIGLSPTRHLHQFVPGFRALADIPAVRLRQKPHRRLRRDPGRTHSNASGQDPSRVIHTRSSMPHRCTGRDCNSSWGRYTFRRGAGEEQAGCEAVGRAHTARSEVDGGTSR